MKETVFFPGFYWYPPMEEGTIIRRDGTKFIAAIDGPPVTELKIRRGRLTAKAGDLWHIIPMEPPANA